jgi:peptidoglycan hydrolase CwlO-like protein
LQCADTQLELVHHRQEQLAQLEDEVSARRRTIESRLRALQVGRAGQPKGAAASPAG